jgi:hypothetical protein
VRSLRLSSTVTDVRERRPLEHEEKGKTMNHIRRMTTIIAGVLLSVLGLIAMAPAAFAERVTDPGAGSGAATSTTGVTHAGMAGWEITLIALGVAAVATVLTAVAFYARVRTRLNPATS